MLSPEEIADLGDGGEVSTEDVLAAQMAARASDKGITYVAFTATPKAKTVEIFGRRPKPDQPAGPDNLPVAFHVYSMRQAIEEGFILDVLKNYTPYRLAFRLANNGKEWDDKEVERDAALKGSCDGCGCIPTTSAKRFRSSSSTSGRMLSRCLKAAQRRWWCLGSRVEAVRWQLAIDKYIKSQGYKIGTLVAFSGEVNDKESGPDAVHREQQGVEPEP